MGLSSLGQLKRFDENVLEIAILATLRLHIFFTRIRFPPPGTASSKRVAIAMMHLSLPSRDFVKVTPLHVSLSPIVTHGLRSTLS